LTFNFIIQSDRLSTGGDALMTPNELKLYIYVHEHVERPKKNPIKTDGRNHYTEDKREGQRKTKRHAAHMNQPKERTSPSRGRRLSDP
jgi:hypothetical protein